MGFRGPRGPGVASRVVKMPLALSAAAMNWAGDSELGVRLGVPTAAGTRVESAKAQPLSSMAAQSLRNEGMA